MVKVDKKNKKAEIDLRDNRVYAVVDGELFVVPSPPEGFGKQIITWHDGKPLKRTKNENVLDFKPIR